MGKGALLLVFSAMLVYSSYIAEDQRIAYERDNEQALYQEAVLSREFAHSAFNIVVSNVTQDFNHFRESVSDRIYGDGTFTWAATGNREGPITVTASGLLDRATHYITAVLERSGIPVVDAVTVDGPVTVVMALGNSYLVTGLDTDPGGVPGSGPNADAHGITTNLESARDAFTSEMDADQVTGMNGQGDIVTGDARIGLQDIVDTVKLHEYVITLEGNQEFPGGGVYGSVNDPAAIIVNGDLDISGDVIGIGILIVNGSLSVTGTVTWEGLIILSGTAHEFKGSADIYGGLIIRSLTEDGESGGYEDAGLAGGHFDVDVYDGVAGTHPYHEHQYDDRYAVDTVDLLRIGCKTDGGLCWSSIVDAPGYAEVLVEYENSAGIDGTFVYETTSLRIEGLLSNGLSRRFAPDDLTELNLTFGAICEVPGSTPDGVDGDPATRDGAVIVRAYDTAPEATGGDPNLIYETVIYRHMESDTCEPPELGEVLDNQVDVEPSSFYINGNVGIYYSSRALDRLTSMVPELESDTVTIIMTQIQEAGERQLN